MSNPVEDSAGFTAMDDEIELQLSAEEVQALSRFAVGDALVPLAAQTERAPLAAEPLQTRAAAPRANAPAIAPPGIRARRFPQVPLLTGLVATAAALGGIAYWGSGREQPVRIAENVVHSTPVTPPPAPPSPPVASAPVRFKNPFDAAEVFEFPAGTTRAQAREAVAELLLERARDRHGTTAVVRQRAKKIVDQDARSATASSPRRS